MNRAAEEFKAKHDRHGTTAIANCFEPGMVRTQLAGSGRTRACCSTLCMRSRSRSPAHRRKEPTPVVATGEVTQRRVRFKTALRALADAGARR